MKVNKSVDATDDLIDLICEEEKKSSKEYWGVVNYFPKKDYPERPFMKKINESISANDELMEELDNLHNEQAKKLNDKPNIVYVIAMTALLGGSGVALWLVWDLVALVWGE